MRPTRMHTHNNEIIIDNIIIIIDNTQWKYSS